MNLDVDVRVSGDKEAAALADRLAGRLSDGTPALRGLVDTLLEAQAERFVARGVTWKPTAASTRARDARGGRDPRLMVLTGALLRSLTVRGARGQVVRITATSLRFGTRIYYARFHQRGDGVPKRTVVGLTRLQRNAVVTELRQLLTREL